MPMARSVFFVAAHIVDGHWSHLTFTPIILDGMFRKPDKINTSNFMFDMDGTHLPIFLGAEVSSNYSPLTKRR